MAARAYALPAGPWLEGYPFPARKVITPETTAAALIDLMRPASTNR